VITIAGVGPSRTNFPRKAANDFHSHSGRITALALAADGQRMYAGSFAGVWRSDDAGETWSQLTRPQPTLSVQGDIPGALYAPHIFDLVVSPVDRDLVLVSALDSQYKDGRDGIYRTTDGGDTWTLVLQETNDCNVVFAPDDPQLVYAVMTRKTAPPSSQNFGVLAISRNAGATWTTMPFSLGSALRHIAVGPLEPDGKRRVYAVGDSVVRYSTDGGQNWRVDLGVIPQIVNVRTVLGAFQSGCGGNAAGPFGGGISLGAGNAPQILAIEPGNPARVYMATTGGALGPTYYHDQVPDGTLVNTDCRRLAGEASVWLGDFSAFELNNERAQWALLPGPPVYSGGSTPSGTTFVATKPTSSGFLLFFSDTSHVHVSAGTPTDNASWHRLDGKNASVEHDSNVLFVHPDPHGLAFTSDFEITLKRSTQASPFNKNSELNQHIAGRLWMANDGGVYFCDDGGRQESSWKMAAGLETLDAINIAGLFGNGDQPALYFGSGDNNDFFTRDGGQHWEDPKSNCGDCDAWFSDMAQGGRVVQFLPRKDPGVFGIIRSGSSAYPDASDSGSKKFPPSPKKVNPIAPTKLKPYAASDVYLAGYRPLILTLATEAPLPDGDIIAVEQALNGTAFLFRTTAITSISAVEDWRDTNKAQQIGPALPSGAIIAQASGGHANPVFYVGNPDPAYQLNTFNASPGSVFKLNVATSSWDKIVPNTSLTTSVKPALMWFVDPYDPNTVYVLDADGVKVSVDGGRRWDFDARFTRGITADNKLKISPSLLQSMLFLRGESQTRFAFGTAGVLWTENFGVEWFPILNSIALPGRPESGFFDPLSNQSDRALYVECEGRSILRIGGIPGPSPFQPPPPIDLMTFAALEY
jgi:photosystem II stability/assembly factor-like uncharacterized protein